MRQMAQGASHGVYSGVRSLDCLDMFTAFLCLGACQSHLIARTLRRAVLARRVRVRCEKGGSAKCRAEIRKEVERTFIMVMFQCLDYHCRYHVLVQ